MSFHYFLCMKPSCPHLVANNQACGGQKYPDMPRHAYRRATCENICKASPSQRNTHVPDWKESRGRPQLLSSEDIKKCERILEDYGIEGKKLGWEGLNNEAGLSMEHINEWMGDIPKMLQDCIDADLQMTGH